MDIKEQIAEKHKVIKDCCKDKTLCVVHGIDCEDCLINAILAIPDLAALLALYEKAEGDISRIAVLDKEQEYPEVPNYEDNKELGCNPACHETAYSKMCHEYWMKVLP